MLRTSLKAEVSKPHEREETPFDPLFIISNHDFEK